MLKHQHLSTCSFHPAGFEISGGVSFCSSGVRIRNSFSDYRSFFMGSCVYYNGYKSFLSDSSLLSAVSGFDDGSSNDDDGLPGQSLTPLSGSFMI